MPTDWKQLIQMAAPAIGGIVGGDKAPAFQQGYQQEMLRIQQEKERKRLEQQRMQQAGSQYRLHALETLAGLDDPDAFDQYRSAFGMGASAYGLPQDAFRDVQFPESKRTAAMEKELSDLLGQLEKSYNLDELADSGAVVKKKDGTTVPVSMALELTRKRPQTASGAVISAPKKASAVPNAGSFEDFVIRYAKDQGKTVDALSSTDIQAARRLYQQADDPVKPDTSAVDALNTEILQLRKRTMEANLAKGGAGSVGSDPLVQAVMANPSLWDTLTPSARTKIAPALSAAGFEAFGKPLAESAITKMSESRAAIQSLQDLRDILKANEQYIGPVAGLSALNPYSPARKAQADIDRVKQRVGKALEGGVLRKEDEDKYKKILATLRDTPETAIYKVDQILQSLEHDLAAFEDEQKRAGRRVNPPADASKPGQKVGRFEIVGVK